MNTHLFNGDIRKDSPRVQLMGEIDEAMAYINLSRLYIDDNNISNLLGMIYADLANVCSICSNDMAKGRVDSRFIDWNLEEWENVRLDSFVTFNKYGSAILNVARTIIRRAERTSISLVETNELDKSILHYLNNLSKLVFYIGAEVEKNGMS